jgi:hypothetical protein
MHCVMPLPNLEVLKRCRNSIGAYYDLLSDILAKAILVLFPAHTRSRAFTIGTVTRDSSPPGTLMVAGGLADGPVPVMPSANCSKEFPMKKGGAPATGSSRSCPV